MQKHLNSDASLGTDVLFALMENIHNVYCQNTYVLIDEYDKLIMDNFTNPELVTIKKILSDLMSSTFKDNPYLAKGVFTGVSQISQESMFSGLNNVRIYSLFSPSVYDNDFSLTESEVSDLYSRPETFAKAVQVILALCKEATTTRAKEHARRS